MKRCVLFILTLILTLTSCVALAEDSDRLFWTNEEFVRQYGVAWKNFNPTDPQSGRYLLVLNGAAQAGPDTGYRDEDAGLQTLTAGISRIVDQIDLVTQALALNLSKTNDPDTASLAIELNIQYVPIDQTYDLVVTLDGYSLLDHELIDTLSAAARCESASGADLQSDLPAAPLPAPDCALWLATLADYAPDPALKEANLTLQILSSLDDPLYTLAYQRLSEGAIIERGDESDEGRALQSMLLSLGRTLTVDGQVGSKTIQALMSVEEALGLDVQEFVDAPLYARLIQYVYIFKTREEGRPAQLLMDSISSQDYYEMINRAVALLPTEADDA